MSKATNKEGMTWQEWRLAAGITPDHFFVEKNVGMFRAAWINGEDPAEYRAALKTLKQAESELREYPCFSQWVSAACGNFDRDARIRPSGGPVSDKEAVAMLDAWKNGEDPFEWRAEYKQRTEEGPKDER